MDLRALMSPQWQARSSWHPKCWGQRTVNVQGNLKPNYWVSAWGWVGSVTNIHARCVIFFQCTLHFCTWNAFLSERHAVSCSVLLFSFLVCFFLPVKPLSVMVFQRLYFALSAVVHLWLKLCLESFGACSKIFGAFSLYSFKCYSGFLPCITEGLTRFLSPFHKS